VPQTPYLARSLENLEEPCGTLLACRHTICCKKRALVPLQRKSPPTGPPAKASSRCYALSRTPSRTCSAAHSTRRHSTPSAIRPSTSERIHTAIDDPNQSQSRLTTRQAIRSHMNRQTAATERLPTAAGLQVSRWENDFAALKSEEIIRAYARASGLLQPSRQRGRPLAIRVQAEEASALVVASQSAFRVLCVAHTRRPDLPNPQVLKQLVRARGETGQSTPALPPVGGTSPRCPFPLVSGSWYAGLDWSRGAAAAAAAVQAQRAQVGAQAGIGKFARSRAISDGFTPGGAEGGGGGGGGGGGREEGEGGGGGGACEPSLELAASAEIAEIAES